MYQFSRQLIKFPALLFEIFTHKTPNPPWGGVKKMFWFSRQFMTFSELLLQIWHPNIVPRVGGSNFFGQWVWSAVTHPSGSVAMRGLTGRGARSCRDKTECECPGSRRWSPLWRWWRRFASTRLRMPRDASSRRGIDSTGGSSGWPLRTAACWHRLKTHTIKR